MKNPHSINSLSWSLNNQNPSKSINTTIRKHNKTIKLDFHDDSKCHKSRLHDNCMILNRNVHEIYFFFERFYKTFEIPFSAFSLLMNVNLILLDCNWKVQYRQIDLLMVRSWSACHLRSELQEEYSREIERKWGNELWITAGA